MPTGADGTSRSWLSATRARFDSMKFAHRFFLAAAIVMVPGMLVIGSWVQSHIRHAVEVNTSGAAALYMEGVVSIWFRSCRSGKT